MVNGAMVKRVEVYFDGQILDRSLAGYCRFVTKCTLILLTLELRTKDVRLVSEERLQFETVSLNK